MANNQLKEELVLSTGQFDKNIENVIKKVEELKNKGGKVGNGFNQSMGDMIKKATGFNGSLGSMMSVVGKLGGVFGVTASAVGVLSNAFKQNETLVDELGRQIETVGAIFDSFCIGLNNLNFDGILNNLSNIIKKAREAADAIDKAQTNAGIRSNQEAMLRALDARDRAIVNNKKSTEAERKAAQERIKSREPLRREAARGNYTDNSNAAKKLIEKRLAEVGISKNNSDYKRIYEKVLKSFYSPNKSIGNVQYEVYNKGKDKNGNWKKETVNLDEYFGDEFRKKVNTYIQSAWNSIEQSYNNENKLNRTIQKGIPNSGGGNRKTNKPSGLDTIKSKVTFTPMQESQESTLVENAKTIEDINNNISIYNKQLEKTVKGSKEWSEINSKIKKESDKLNDYQKGSIADLQNQISEIDKRLANENLIIPTRLELKAKKEELQKQIDHLTMIGEKPIKVRLETEFDKSFAEFENTASSIFGAFAGIDNVVSNIDSLSRSIEDGANAWQIFMGVLQTGMSIINGVASVMETVNFLTELFGVTSTVAAGEKIAADTAENTSELAGIPTKAAATAANKALEASTLDLAAAAIFAAHAAIPFAGVGIAGGFIGTMMGAMAAQHAASLSLQAYAEGGVVGGSNYAGDALLARVNSGEMILNGSHQKKLFDLIDKGYNGNVNNSKVEFIIKGKDLQGVLNNYDDKMKKVR